jgi:hypothetical protein
MVVSPNVCSPIERDEQTLPFAKITCRLCQKVVLGQIDIGGKMQNAILWDKIQKEVLSS